MTKPSEFRLAFIDLVESTLETSTESSITINYRLPHGVDIDLLNTLIGIQCRCLTHKLDDAAYGTSRYTEDHGVIPNGTEFIKVSTTWVKINQQSGPTPTEIQIKRIADNTGRLQKELSASKLMPVRQANNSFSLDGYTVDGLYNLFKERLVEELKQNPLP